MKKTLALVLALALVFSTVTVAFAEEPATVGADAKVCTDLGMLVGDGNGVTPAYLATNPTRIQAAVMVLRLRGLEAEAKAFTGEGNFADADKAAWAKPIMGYLKAHPELGWLGDGTNFNPTANITAKEYAKAMLETLGYKQNTAEVVGDFAWENVAEFAAGKGLTNAAAATFTVNDLAVATVEALKATVKEGGKTLVATLVEAGKVSKDAAVAAGVYTDVTTTTAKLNLAQVVGNNKVLAQFDAAVDKTFAENSANFKVVEKGTTTAVEVKAAVLDGTKQVVLETAALTAGKAYTLTVGDVSMNFAGVAKSSTVPEIDTVEGTDTERVVITYTTAMDLGTALDPANYAIDGVTVKSAAWDDNKDRDAVELTTEGMTANKTYTVKVTNVQSVDGVVLKSASKNFVSKTDKKAPVLDAINSDPGNKTNTRIVVEFKDDNELSAESAENVANYELTYGSDSKLDITAAKLVEDSNDDLKWVELTTASQKSGQKYTLHVNNIADTSVLGNKMTKEDTITVYGVKADTDEPSLNKVEYLSKNIIEVKYTDKSRLDFASAQDINNYEVNNDVVIEKAEMTDAEDPDCYTVKLTVSTLEDKTSYKITVDNIADEYGNTMDASSKTLGYKSDYDVVSTIDKIITTSTNEMVVIFTKPLDEASAEDVANYSISGDIGAPKKATYDGEDSTYSNKPTVTLKTGAMSENSGYTLTINGVVDEADRVLTNVKSGFRVAKDTNDYERPTVEDVEAANQNVVRVTFSEPMAESGSIILKVDPTVAADGTISGGTTVNGTYAVAYDDDDMVFEYTLDRPFAEGDNTVYLSGVTATDVAGNSTDNDNVPYEFSPNSDPADDLTVDSYDQVNVQKFELQFSEKISDTIANSGLTDNTIREITTGATFNVSLDDDDSSIVYLEKASGTLSDDHEYEFDLRGIKNNHNQAAVNTDDTTYTVLESYMVDDEKPYIESVEAVNRNKIEVKFNEDLKSAGSYSLSYENEDGDTKTLGVTNPGPDADDLSLVVLTPSKALDADTIYTLVQESTKAKDLSGNSIDAATDDELYDFAGTNVIAIANHITGVKIYNGTKVRVYAVDDFVGATVTAAVYKGTSLAAANKILLTTATPACKDNYATINIAVDPTIGASGEPVNAFMEDTTYTVVVNGMSYEFDGIVEDTINVEETTPGTYDVSYDDSEVGDVVSFVTSNGATVTQVVTDTILADGEDATISGVTGYNDPATVATEKIVGVVVTRDGVVIYYKGGLDLNE